MGTPPKLTDQKFTFNDAKDGNDLAFVAPHATALTPPSNRTHRVVNSDASSLDLNFDEQGSVAHLSPLLSASPPCIQQLGAIGAEILTGNQKQSIVELCHLLRGGILVLKHGRSGKPNLRTLYCDEALTTLYWSEVGKIVNGAGVVIFDASGLSPSLAFSHPHPLSPLSGHSQTSFHDAQLTDSVGARFQHLMDQNTIRNMTKKRRSSLGLNGMKVFSKSNHREVVVPEILEVEETLPCLLHPCSPPSLTRLCRCGTI